MDGSYGSPPLPLLGNQKRHTSSCMERKCLMKAWRLPWLHKGGGPENYLSRGVAVWESEDNPERH